MAWIKLTDNYLDDEQIHALTDGSFRLWHEGIAYSRRNKTDGLIPFVIMCGFKSYTKGREKQLSTAHREGLEPLWVLVPGMGYRIKSYLKWNPSKEQETRERELTADRQRKFRGRNAVTEPLGVTLPPPLVLERVGTGGREEKEDDAISARAGRLREELYPAWYAKFRHGARLKLIASSLEYQDAMTICRTWDDATIEKLARIVLTTDDDWISRTDRSFRIFALKASWADDRLRQAEQRTA